MCGIPLTAWLCGLQGGKEKNKQRPMSRLSALISTPSPLGETLQFRGSARNGHLPQQIFQKPAPTSNAHRPFSQHQERKARPPQTGGTGLELVPWSVAVLDAQPRSCFEVEAELTKAIKNIVPPTTQVDCTVTVTHTLTSSRVKIVDMLLPWSYSLVIKDHVRTEWPVYAQDHDPLMPEEFLTTTLPGPTSTLRGTTNDDEWLAVFTESSDPNDMQEATSTIKAFLEALYADIQPCSTYNRTTSKHTPVSATLMTEVPKTNNNNNNATTATAAIAHSALLLSAPSTVRELVGRFLSQQKSILRVYVRPTTNRAREEIEKRNRRAGTWPNNKLEEGVRRPSLERWVTMYGDGKS